MPKPQIDLSFLPVPNVPYSPEMSESALSLYMWHRKQKKLTEQLVCEFEEEFLGTFCKLEDFVWQSLRDNLVFPQVQAIGLEVRHIDLEQLAYEWFNSTKECSASYVKLQPLPECGYFHIFSKHEV